MPPAGGTWTEPLKLDQHMESNTVSRIKAALEGALTPVSIHITDESHLHIGHVGAARRQVGASLGTHYRISIVSEAFKGKARIERHRMVNRILRPEFGAGLHALAIEAKAPGE
jgi:BolA family transcriptional regulator, general stress-responsive regulator